MKTLSDLLRAWEDWRLRRAMRQLERERARWRASVESFHAAMDEYAELGERLRSVADRLEEQNRED